MTHFPRPWWYSLALRIAPGRCREIPEAQNPDRIILRQVALVKNRRELQLLALTKILFASGWRERFWRSVLWLASFANVYLQQFASDEDPRFMHCHPYKFMIAIGLWGGYTEHRIAGAPKRRRAPYLYTMDGGHVHHAQAVTKGHTSIFAGFGRAIDGTIGDKHYYGVPVDANPKRRFVPSASMGQKPETRRTLWSDHIKVFVERI